MKQRIPRKLKKRTKGSIILLDLASIPKGMDLDQWMFLYRKHGVMIYEGTQPKVFYPTKQDFKNNIK